MNKRYVCIASLALILATLALPVHAADKTKDAADSATTKKK